MPTLASVLDRRLLLVTGKGGTGKSAVAASLAIAAGRRGLRVLALAMDQGVGLARHLGLSHLGPEPEHLGAVFAARVDPAAALDEYLRMRIPVPRVAPIGRIFAAVVETVPGVRDTVVMGKVVFESTRSRWDLVVADTPATGQVSSFLAAPGTIAGLVPGGAVREQAAWLRTLLADVRHTGLVVTATPEELPVIEAVHFRTEVETTGAAHIAAVVANKVLPPADFEVGDDAPIAHRDAARLHVALTTGQRDHLDSLRPDRVIPYHFGMLGPHETGARIADMWEERP